MPWAEPQYSRQQINAGGKTLLASMSDAEDHWRYADWAKYDQALTIINNHRSSHGYPLNTFSVNLRHAAGTVDSSALVAQRTKRLTSIGAKLERQPKMKLTQMQDVGGCRAVVKSVLAVRGIVEHYRISRMRYEPASFDDYIQQPKASGYRGVHLTYRYFSDKPAKAIYNGLKIEMQLRSRYQHAWATAVETVSTFVGQALKSSAGSDDWLRFFALMGTAIAIREKAPEVPRTPTRRLELVAELSYLATALNVANRLRTFGSALQALKQPSVQQARYYLLELDPRTSQLTVTGFRTAEMEEASRRYLDAERKARDNPGRDAVLVSVESITALERAYPNYFADTRVFMRLLDQVLTGSQSRIRQVPAGRYRQGALPL